MRITNLVHRLTKLGLQNGKRKKQCLAAAVVTGGMLFSGAATNGADIVLNGGFEIAEGDPGSAWTNQGGDYTHPYGGINGPQLTDIGTLSDYGFNDDISADAGLVFHGLATPTTQTINLVNTDLTAQNILDGEGRYAFSAWLATCCGDDPKVTATFDTGNTVSLNRGIATHLQTTADILVNPGGANNAESMGVSTDASRRYWALYEFRGAIPTNATEVTIAVDDGRADAGITSGNGNDNYADMIIFDAVQSIVAVPDLFLKISIDRDTGAIQLINGTGAPQDVKGYSLVSDDGALLESAYTPLADSDSDWVQFTASGSLTDLSEGHLTADTLAVDASVSLGSAWTQYYREADDLTFTYLQGNGATQEGLIEFTSASSTLPFDLGDLDFDGDVDSADWVTYSSNLQSDLSGVASIAQSYALGDLDGDLDNDHADFRAFQSAYDAANGAGAFTAMLTGSTVPEPGTLALFALANVTLLGFGHRRREVIAAS